ncbi:hypothetical protein E2C01_049155 [Portunus trituberculatus]|uniref:Uncharacterized protein n=1 Tax=Portunus trituberculatus TaxID=210409 RepID=A0A5B7GD63_PORTR|nr:hypothetical protein [Portunus trituberculatus]
MHVSKRYGLSTREEVSGKSSCIKCFWSRKTAALNACSASRVAAQGSSEGGAQEAAALFMPTRLKGAATTCRHLHRLQHHLKACVQKCFAL